VIQHVFAGVPVADFERAVPFYERLFGRPPDVIVHASEVMWQLAGSGWVYVVADPERAGHALVTLLVDDLDERLRELAERGIEAGGVETLGSGVRTVRVLDADGNRVQLGEVPPGSVGA
jgi:predicted enzyme related to lactoylglutathione lyase